MLDFYRFSHFQQYPDLIHAVTNKNKHHPYHFSLALHTGEEAKKVIQNRQYVTKVLGYKKEMPFIVANQTHSNHVKIIYKTQSKGWEKAEDAIEDCDALITNVPELTLTILTADCVPILLYDPKHKVIAAVHAGWKGTEANIVLKTLEKMAEVFGSEAKDVLAGVGPAIGSCCYEVGEDVAKHFFNYPEALEKKETKYMLDLPLINQKQLLSFGIQETHIEMSSVCTSCEVEHYFSYRKEKGCTGRFMSLIALKKP